MRIIDGEACPHGGRLANCPHRECSLERRRRQGPTPAELVRARELESAAEIIARIVEKPTTEAELVEAIYYRAQDTKHGRLELIRGPILPDAGPGQRVVATISINGQDYMALGSNVYHALYGLHRSIVEGLAS